MSARVLITGGLGYLGGRLGRHLAERGREVVLGTRRSAPLPRLTFEASVASFQFADEAGLARALEGAAEVVHLAALNDTESAADPAAAMEVNAGHTRRLLAAARRAGVRRVLYMSTAHVYGAPLEGRIDEATPARPSHPYAATHRAAEELVLAAHAEGALEGVAVRLSNGYGPPLWPEARCWTLVCNDLCRQAVTSRRMVLKSSGLQRRDFVPIGDVARAVEQLLTVPVPSLQDGLFNLGGDAAWSIHEMAQRIALRAQALLGAPVAIERPEPAPGARSAPLDYRTDKLRATGYAAVTTPESEIDGTLRACMEWFT